MLNQQPIEKQSRRTDGQLDVHSIFYTIQGEGPFCGTPAIFIRLAGCNLQCPWCDTEYTKGRRLLFPSEILSELLQYRQPNALVVITGGEPFRQNLTELLDTLQWAGFFVQIETNGTLPPSQFNYNLDVSQRKGVYIVCSPKSGKVNSLIWEKACCAKYVLDYQNMVEPDGLPLTALGHRANPYVARPPVGWNRLVYLQPADHKDEAHNKANIQAVVQSAMKHGYIVQLQIHKLLEVE